MVQYVLYSSTIAVHVVVVYFNLEVYVVDKSDRYESTKSRIKSHKKSGYWGDGSLYLFYGSKEERNNQTIRLEGRLR